MFRRKNGHLFRIFLPFSYALFYFLPPDPASGGLSLQAYAPARGNRNRVRRRLASARSGSDDPLSRQTDDFAAWRRALACNQLHHTLVAHCPLQVEERGVDLPAE
jgi:hypothetical protein